MRVAALYDIHANLPALEAVLEEVRRAEVQQIVVGGDVLPGPMPGETLTRLLRLDVPVQFIYGNGEVAVLEQMAGRQPGAVPEQYRPIIRWTAQQLDAEHERWLRAWPKTLRLAIPDLGEVLFCHATPQNENDCFTSRTPEHRLLPIFKGINADVVVCGHTHMQFDRIVGKIRVLNAGSVGMPFGQPGADWLLLGPYVQFRHTNYDVPKAVARIRATSYPGAQEFATHNVLQPPSAEKMLEAFARADLK
jgi:putative phosphoesterase